VLDFVARFEDDGVTRFQRKCADLSDGIGTGFEDDSQHADGTTDFLEH